MGVLSSFLEARTSKPAKKKATKKKVVVKKAAKKAKPKKLTAKQLAAQRAAAQRAAAEAAARQAAAQRAAQQAAAKSAPKPAPAPTPAPVPVPTPPPPPPREIYDGTLTIYTDVASAVANTPHAAMAPLYWDPASHLLSRFAFGPTIESRSWIEANGAQAWWDQQVALAQSTPLYSGNAAVAAKGTMLGLTPAQVRAQLKANGNEFGWDLMDQLTEVTVGLQIFSNAQLYETVVDFFANHLNVANHSDEVWCSRQTFDRNVVRTHAFGSFTNMLLASAKDPAMLAYLNLAQSKKTAINENYGRELLELHTVGIGNYTETDVKNASKILTGRTLDANQNYVYNANWHWTGALTVMGFSHANSTASGGEAAGDAFVRYLAAHPKTAERLARKLCVRFVSDTPSDALVRQVANAYTNSGTQILPMLQTIVRSNEFWASRGLKVRRPAENLVATIRVLGNQPSDLSRVMHDMHWMCYSLGQVPLDWATPDGYPDVAEAWRSSGTLLQNWQYIIGFVQSWWTGWATLDVNTLYGGVTPLNSGHAINLLTKRLTNMTFSDEHRQYLQNFLNEPATTPIAKSNLQWYLSHLIPLILEGPHHALR